MLSVHWWLDTGDVRDDYEKSKSYMKGISSAGNLTPETRKIIAEAIKFGYVAAFSARTCDMNEMTYQAMKFEDGYKAVLKLFDGEGK